MKVTGLVVIIATIAGTSEAIDAGAIINFKTQIGNYLVNQANAVLQAKQNLILSGTKTVLSAKQNLIQRQLPHLVRFKTEKINSILQLKKNLLSTTAAQLGQIHISSGGGREPPEESYDEVNASFSPPAGPVPSHGPPSIVPEEPASSYGPPPPPRPTSSFGPPPRPTSSYGPPPRPASSYEPLPLEPAIPTPYVKPASSPSCVTCSQSVSSPSQFPPYRPGAHVQPAPPPRPQSTYGPPSRPQSNYGPPALAAPPPPPQLPSSYGLPARLQGNRINQPLN